MMPKTMYVCLIKTKTKKHVCMCERPRPKWDVFRVYSIQLGFPQKKTNKQTVSMNPHNIIQYFGSTIIIY